MDIASEQKIRERAYEIWVAAGMREGDADQHWLHAEQAVRHEVVMPRQRVKAATAKAAPAAAAKVVAKAGSSKPADTKNKAAGVRTAKNKAMVMVGSKVKNVAVEATA